MNFGIFRATKFDFKTTIQMKTLSLRKAGDFDVKLKCDIFATNAELQVPGFDTRFTHMEIEGYKDNDLAIQTLGQIQEIENNYQAIVALATATAGVGLYVQDINDNGGTAEIELVAP